MEIVISMFIVFFIIRSNLIPDGMKVAKVTRVNVRNVLIENKIQI